MRAGRTQPRARVTHDLVEQLARAVWREPTRLGLQQLSDAMRDTDSWGVSLDKIDTLLSFPESTDDFWVEACGVLNQLLSTIELHRGAEHHRQLIEAHCAVVEAKVKELRDASIQAYSSRDQSNGYWLREYANLLSNHIGYVHIVKRSLVGIPPAGTIWVRPATGGRYGRGRIDKYGRRLTLDELRAMPPWTCSIFENAGV